MKIGRTLRNVNGTSISTCSARRSCFRQLQSRLPKYKSKAWSSFLNKTTSSVVSSWLDSQLLSVVFAGWHHHTCLLARVAGAVPSSAAPNHRHCSLAFGTVQCRVARHSAVRDSGTVYVYIYIYTYIHILYYDIGIQCIYTIPMCIYIYIYTIHKAI